MSNDLYIKKHFSYFDDFNGSSYCLQLYIIIILINIIDVKLTKWLLLFYFIDRLHLLEFFPNVNDYVFIDII